MKILGNKKNSPAITPRSSQFSSLHSEIIDPPVFITIKAALTSTYSLDSLMLNKIGLRVSLFALNN